MSSRERKRAERSKRKRRAAERAGQASGETASEMSNQDGERMGPRSPTAPAGNGGAFEAVQAADVEPESLQERMARRSEQRNAEVRSGLEPLAEGERPRAVTIGAIVSAAIALVWTASGFVAVFDLIEISGTQPSPFPLFLAAATFWLMTYGLVKARYWAVLGFQMLLLLVILSSALALVQVATIAQVIGSLLLLGGAGALFYFMIRAMARIQMPERPGER